MSLPLEVLIARKLEARFSSLHDAFLSMDLDGSGTVSLSELKNSLHMYLGIEVTNSQIVALFARFAPTKDAMEEDSSMKKDALGIRYSEFVTYLYNVARDTSRSTSSTFYLPSLDSNSNMSDKSIKKDPDLPTQSIDTSEPFLLHHLTTELPILDAVKPPSNALSKDILHALRRKIMTRSSSQTSNRKSRLFLEMDVDRSGKITPSEFQSWTAKMGLVLTSQQCQLILGEYATEDGIDLSQFIQFLDSFESFDNSSIHSPSPLSALTELSQEASQSNAKPWETPNPSTIRTRRLDARALAEETTKTLHQAFAICTEATHTDQQLCHSLSSELYAKQKTLLQAFSEIDENHDGRIDPSELQQALLDFAGIHISLDRAKALVIKFDRDGDGRWSKSDFIYCISNNQMEAETVSDTTQASLDTTNKINVSTRSRATESTLTSFLFPSATS